MDGPSQLLPRWCYLCTLKLPGYGILGVCVCVRTFIYVCVCVRDEYRRTAKVAFVHHIT